MVNDDGEPREEKRGEQGMFIFHHQDIFPIQHTSFRRFEKGRCGVAVSDSAKA